MWEKVDKVVAAGVDTVYPGATLLVGRPGTVLHHRAYGTSDGCRPVKTNAIYDVASLTKVVATTTAIMYLLAEGEITLQDPLGRYLQMEEIAGLTIYQCLTHTTGMSAYSDLWRHKQGVELRQALLCLPPLFQKPKKIVYSCLNFIALMGLVEAVVGEKFNTFIEGLFSQAGMINTTFSPGANDDVVPTSMRDGQRIVGLPDDELAYYLGGVSGNAGLFSHTHDLFIFLSKLLEGAIVPLPVVEKFTTELVQLGDDRRRLGWLAPAPNSSGGDFLSTRAFGHTGFTGTSLWVEPGKGFVIFLTNRVFIRRRGGDIHSIRRRLHNVVFSHL